MSASSTARTFLTFVVVLAVVGSAVVVPVAAAGDDTVATDGATVGVNTENESVTVDAAEPSVSVDSSGVDSDGAPSDTALTTSGTSAGDEELPFDYSDLPLEVLPVNLCEAPVGPGDVPDPPSPPKSVPEPPQAPVGAPSAPISHCNVFNPYSPPFDPTDLPDGPSYDVTVYRQDVSQDGATVVAGGSASPGSEWPFAAAVVGVSVTKDGVSATKMARGNDGQHHFYVFNHGGHQAGTKQGTVQSRSIAYGKHGSMNVVCGEEACTVTVPGPVPDQSIPTSRNDGDGGGSGAPTVPCSYPVGPGDVPEPPSPPKQAPELPQAPVGIPSPPLTPCAVFNPNDPPTLGEGDADYTIYRQDVDRDGATVVAGGQGRSGDVFGSTIAGVQVRKDSVAYEQLTRGDDGQKEYYLRSNVHYAPGTRQGDLGVNVGLFGKRDAVNVVCDGEACTVSVPGPVPDESIPTSRSGRDDGGSSDGLSMPCSYPVGPDDVPEPPSPPEQAPRLPETPIGVPSAPFGPCTFFDLNERPSTNPNPAYGYTVYELDDDTAVVGGTAAYNRSSGPWATTVGGVQRGDEVSATTLTRGDDSQNRHYAFTHSSVDPQSAVAIGPDGVHVEGDSTVLVRAFGKSGDATMGCDGEFCYFRTGSAPVGEQKIRISDGSDSRTSADEPSGTTASSEGSSTTASDSGRSTAESRSTGSSSSAGGSSSVSTRTDRGSTASVVPDPSHARAVEIRRSLLSFDGSLTAARLSEALLQLI